MIQSLLVSMGNMLWSTPLLVFVTGTAVIGTVLLKGLQFTKFAGSWKLILADSGSGQKSGEMTGLQAFLKVLNIGLGNGSLAGVATAIHMGGPGAVFWIFILGLVFMILRFIEVFLATSFISTGLSLTGPFLYLSKVPGGKFLPTIYAIFCLCYAFSAGNAMQCNSISMAITTILPVSAYVVGGLLSLFMVYLFLGGSKRIIKISQYVVPVKVILFFITCGGVLLYNIFSIPAALILVIKSAFSSQALGGAAIGYSVQQAFKFGLLRVINATEAGIGTAAVVYGSADVKSPVESGLTAMIGNFICSNIVCFMVGLSIVVTGVYKTGLNGSALTSAAFQTTFGTSGGWVVAFLSLLFGMGVFVAYSYVGMQCWLFLTNNRFQPVFVALFTVVAFIGANIDIKVVWAAVDIVNGCCLLVNLYGISMLFPYIKRNVECYFEGRC